MKNYHKSACAALVLLAAAAGLFAQEEVASKTWTSGEAWSYLKDYQYGDDWAPLLLIEDEVEQAGADAESEKAMGAKLAVYLTDDNTAACRQFACMQLRLVGGAAEVPALATLLQRPEEAENARLALEVIPAAEALVPLRAALQTFEGTALVGVINSLAKRQDTESFSAILELTRSEDESVKSAAVYALGKFGPMGLAALNSANFPVEDPIAGQAALNIADELARDGKIDQARPIYEQYSIESAQRGCRKAALVGLLACASDRHAAILEWFTGTDPMKVRLAAAHLSELSEEEFTALSEKQSSMSDLAKSAYLEIGVEKSGDAMLEKLVAELASDDTFTQATAARLLGRLGAAEAVPALIPLLASNNTAVAVAATESLGVMPHEIVTPILIDVMKTGGPEAPAAIRLLASIKAYEAIDPMIELAKSEDSSVREVPLAALAQLADPDDNDLSRLLNLYRHAAANGYRDKAERTLVLVCQKADDSPERIAKLSADESGELSTEAGLLLLPLLGKLGGDFAYDKIETGMKSADPKIAAAALRGFCNWPDAAHADELWNIAKTSKSAAARQMALRAFIRVITLKSDRPAAETLAKLKDAFAAANDADTRGLILARAAEIRDMAVVEWLTGFLDDAELSESACASIAKLAHHRELREPNKAAFAPILERVEKTAKDKAVAEAAQKARLGM